MGEGGIIYSYGQNILRRRSEFAYTISETPIILHTTAPIIIVVLFSKVTHTHIPLNPKTNTAYGSLDIGIKTAFFNILIVVLSNLAIKGNTKTTSYIYILIQSFQAIPFLSFASLPKCSAQTDNPQNEQRQFLEECTIL